MSNHHVPALLGDRNGNYRILVVGNCGNVECTGKSTLSSALAKKLNLPCISLDRLFWNPGWVETPETEFKARVQEALDNSPRGWVVDGNYTRQIGLMVQQDASDIIWLDPPLVLYFPRIFWRTMRRWFLLDEPCSPGCYEDLRSIFFSKDGILWFCLSYHKILRRRYGKLMSRIGLDIGSDIRARRMRRIGGWGGDLRAWWQGVEQLMREKM